jgi:hypothetical protein
MIIAGENREESREELVMTSGGERTMSNRIR